MAEGTPGCFKAPGPDTGRDGTSGSVWGGTTAGGTVPRVRNRVLEPVDAPPVGGLDAGAGGAMGIDDGGSTVGNAVLVVRELVGRGGVFPTYPHCPGESHSYLRCGKQ